MQACMFIWAYFPDTLCWSHNLRKNLRAQPLILYGFKPERYTTTTLRPVRKHWTYSFAFLLSVVTFCILDVAVLLCMKAAATPSNRLSPSQWTRLPFHWASLVQIKFFWKRMDKMKVGKVSESRTRKKNHANWQWVFRTRVISRKTKSFHILF